MAVEIVISNPDSHAGLFHAVVVERYASQNAFFPKCSVVVVHEEQAGGRIAGDVDIRPAVFIEIGADRGHAIVFVRLGYAGCLAHVGERAVSIVTVQMLPRERQSSGAALYRNAFPVAVNAVPWLRHADEVELQVVRDEKIQVPVAIVINERTAGSPARRPVIPQAGLFCHIGETTVAVVAIERVLAPVRAKEILEAVIVVIAHANRRRPSYALKAGLDRHVRERAIAVVMIEAIRRSWRRAANAGSGEQKNVHPSVVVIVNECTATAVGLDD